MFSQTKTMMEMHWQEVKQTFVFLCITPIKQLSNKERIPLCTPADTFYLSVIAVKQSFQSIWVSEMMKCLNHHPALLTLYLSAVFAVTSLFWVSSTLCPLVASRAGRLDTLYGDSTHLLPSPGKAQHLGTGWHAVTGWPGNSSISHLATASPSQDQAFQPVGEGAMNQVDGKIVAASCSHRLQATPSLAWRVFFSFLIIHKASQWQRSW